MGLQATASVVMMMLSMAAGGWMPPEPSLHQINTMLYVLAASKTTVSIIVLQVESKFNLEPPSRAIHPSGIVVVKLLGDCPLADMLGRNCLLVGTRNTRM